MDPAWRVVAQFVPESDTYKPASMKLKLASGIYLFNSKRALTG
jgi:hypothetical protein